MNADIKKCMPFSEVARSAGGQFWCNSFSVLPTTKLDVGNLFTSKVVKASTFLCSPSQELHTQSQFAIDIKYVSQNVQLYKLCAKTVKN